jgi:hypothetical protein
MMRIVKGEPMSALVSCEELAVEESGNVGL